MAKKKMSRSGRVQGEGDYEAGRRFNEASNRFVATHDVASIGRRAAPGSPEESAELKRAEAAGKARAKGKTVSARGARRSGPRSR